jgi:hypothetical protein
LLWFVAAAAGILAVAGGAGAPSAGRASAEELLARALEVIEQQSVQIEQQSLEIRELREQNAQLVRVNEELRELVGEQAARLAEANESLAVLQRMVFGRKSPAEGRGDLGLPGRRVLLPGLRGAVHPAGDAPVRGAAGLAGHDHGARELPAPL